MIVILVGKVENGCSFFALMVKPMSYWMSKVAWSICNCFKWSLHERKSSSCRLKTAQNGRQVGVSFRVIRAASAYLWVSTHWFDHQQQKGHGRFQLFRLYYTLLFNNHITWLPAKRPAPMEVPPLYMRGIRFAKWFLLLSDIFTMLGVSFSPVLSNITSPSSVPRLRSWRISLRPAEFTFL